MAGVETAEKSDYHERGARGCVYRAGQQFSDMVCMFACCYAYSIEFPSAKQTNLGSPLNAPPCVFAICEKACAIARQNGVRVTRMLLLLFVHYGIHFPGNAAWKERSLRLDCDS